MFIRNSCKDWKIVLNISDTINAAENLNLYIQ